MKNIYAEDDEREWRDAVLSSLGHARRRLSKEEARIERDEPGSSIDAIKSAINAIATAEGLVINPELDPGE